LGMGVTVFQSTIPDEIWIALAARITPPQAQQQSPRVDK
jgi:hypothetical protein